MVAYKTKRRDRGKRESKTLKGSKRSKKGKKVAGPDMKHDQLDVTKIEQVAQLVEHIKNNVVTLVLIYADWCGHCGVFKKGIWKKLAEMKNRKMPMALINDSILKETPFADLKIDGYPSTTLIGKDMKAATVKKGDGEETNALQGHNDLDSMTRLVTVDPSEIVRDHSLNMSASKEDVSATPTPEAEKARKESAENVLNLGMSEEESAVVPNPPNTDDDLLTPDIQSGSVNDLREKEDTRDVMNQEEPTPTTGGGKTRRTRRTGTLKKLKRKGRK
jgi:hypothetical protein